MALAAQIAVDDPVLAAPAPAGGTGASGRALLEHQLILPVLDGLDELPEALWAVAVTRVSEALYPGEAVVVSSDAHTKGRRVPVQGAPARIRGQWCWNCGLLMPQLPAMTRSTEPPTRMGGFRFCRPSEPLLLWAVP